MINNILYKMQNRLNNSVKVLKNEDGITLIEVIAFIAATAIIIIHVMLVYFILFKL